MDKAKYWPGEVNARKNNRSNCTQCDKCNAPARQVRDQAERGMIRAVFVADVAIDRTIRTQRHCFRQREKRQKR